MPIVLVVDDSPVDRRLVGGLLGKDLEWLVEYAENGVEALEKMQEFTPDLVLTDLQMPEMDGLELVTASRIHHPGVPVILMTAHGSEAIAIEALEQGAASYVPKSHLAEMLLDTVEQVLTLSRTDRTYERLIACLEKTEFEFVIKNDPSLFDPLIDLVQQIVVGMNLCDATERLRVGGALEQALLNALYRGNFQLSFEQLQETGENLLEGKDYELIEQRKNNAPYCERKIYAHIYISPNEARFVVRDEGPGFDVSSVPETVDEEALEGQRGRGLVLMRTFMDEVYFNEAGNEVTMIKRRQSKD